MNEDKQSKRSDISAHATSHIKSSCIRFVVSAMGLIIVFLLVPTYKDTVVFYVHQFDPESAFPRFKEFGYGVLAAVVMSWLFIRMRFSFKSFIRRFEIHFATHIVLTMATLATIFLGYYGWRCWEAVPRIPDSLVYLFQAKIFASGKLWAPVPEMLKRFDYMFTLSNDNWWISRYSPGFPLLLAIGYLIRLPWFISPVFAGIDIYLVYRLYIEMYSHRILALFTSFLFLISPYFLGISGQILTHAPALFFFLMFCFYGIRMYKNSNASYAAIAGFSAGFFFLIRQMSALTLLFPFVLYFFYKFLKLKKFKLLLIFIICGMMILALQLGYNTVFTGNPFVFPFHQGEFGQLDQLGFYKPVKWDVWPEPGEKTPVHTPMKAVKNIHLCLTILNRTLWGWSVSFLFIPFAYFRKPRTGKQWDILWLLAFICMLIGYGFYWFPGAGLLGARYYYEGLPFLIFLTVRGLQQLQILINHWFGDQFEWFPFWMVIALFSFSSYYFWPDHSKLIYNAFAKSFTPFFRNIQNNTKKPAIIFMAGDTTRYSIGFFKNDIDLDQSVIYARDAGPAKNANLLQQYTNRHPYLYQNDFQTDRLISLKKNGAFLKNDLLKYCHDTAVYDPFHSIDSDVWQTKGNGKNLITQSGKKISVKGILDKHMAPGSSADLTYQEIPVAEMMVSAQFKILNLDGCSIALAIENGRYLDDFQDLMAVHLVVTQESDKSTPFVAFNSKGFGYHWNHQIKSLSVSEFHCNHTLKIHFNPSNGSAIGYYDDQLVGRFYLDFRSSILKIRLSVFHDGHYDRAVHVEWNSFLLEYVNPEVNPATWNKHLLLNIEGS